MKSKSTALAWLHVNSLIIDGLLDEKQRRWAEFYYDRNPKGLDLYVHHNKNHKASHKRVNNYGIKFNLVIHQQQVRYYSDCCTCFRCF